MNMMQWVVVNFMHMVNTENKCTLLSRTFWEKPCIPNSLVLSSKMIGSTDLTCVLRDKRNKYTKSATVSLNTISAPSFCFITLFTRDP